MRMLGLLITLMATAPLASPAQYSPLPEGSSGTFTQAPDPAQREENVNARYVVEHVDIRGIRESDMTTGLRDDLQALVGHRLDSEEARRLERRIEADLRRYRISRRILRGSEPGRIRLVYEARRGPDRWLRFEPLRSNVIYHSEQGWGSYLDLGIGRRDIRFTPILALGTTEGLVEEYSGIGLRFETRRMGTPRLGVSLEWSTFDPDWRAATFDALDAAPQIPRHYSQRSTVTPLVRFALSPDVSLSAGVSITELDAVTAAGGSQMANAAAASIAYDRRLRDASGEAHELYASVGVRAGSRALESDLVYTRYLAQGWYRYDRGKHRVVVTGMAGGITGDAPLFERFVLGDATTLRGWDKYEIAPAGGERMFHSSVEYGYRGLGGFFDLGSVWDLDQDSRVRASTGLSLRAGPAFFTVGFPLNTANLSASFAMGLRVGLGTQR